MLADLIKQHAAEAAAAGDWETVATIVNGLTREVRVTELRTARWLMLNLNKVVGTQNGVPITEADVVLGTLQNPNMPPRVRAAYDGLDLSETQVQQMVPLLAAAGAGWPAGLAQKVMQAGRRVVNLFETPVTAENCRETVVGPVIAARIINASALAKERILTTDTPEQQVAKWTQAWMEAV